MSDIVYWGDEYQREVDQLTTAVHHLKSLISSSNNKLISQATLDCESKLTRIREVKKSYGLELRLVKDKALKAEHEVKIKSLDDIVTNITKEFKDIQAANSRNQLLQSGSNNPYDTTGRTNDELLAGANVLQDKTVESLLRSKALIAQSREVGAATVDQLRAQRDQMKEIEADIDKIQSNMERAERLVTNFTRRMASDRIIQAFTAVNVCVLISLVIYVLVTGKRLEAGARKNPYLSQIIGGSPTRYPTTMPSPTPTTIPSISPTLVSPYPTALSTFSPSFRPTALPSFIPTNHPTWYPSILPSAPPSLRPTVSVIPSSIPTFGPTTSNPSQIPSFNPSPIPSFLPSSNPTILPTTATPTEVPSAKPSFIPTPQPSIIPTQPPTSLPTPEPSVIPTASPSP